MKPRMRLLPNLCLALAGMLTLAMPCAIMRPAESSDAILTVTASQPAGMTVDLDRDRGPLWVIHPLDDHPELNSEDTHSKMIWQVRRLDVE